MTTQYKNEIILIRLLKDIYSNKVLRTSLVLKGESAAYLFYNQPKFSLNLDFDLLDKKKYEFAIDELKKIILSHDLGQKIKDTISKNMRKNKFSLKNYLGNPM